ncbi:MAG: ferrous iron transporter B [Polyangiaceae bacterium]
MARPSAEAAPRVLLFGRPNSGKSSLYNALTGGHARVGNYPGITVDILESRVRLGNGKEASIVDLPGTYSLTAPVDGETDEGVARRCLDDTKSAFRGNYRVVQVLDATQLELGLRLTHELAKAGVPLLLFVSQYDRLKARNQEIDASALSRAIGVPVACVNGRSKAAGNELRQAIQRSVMGPSEEAPAPTWSPKEVARSVLVRKGDATSSHVTASFDRVLLHPLMGPLVFFGLMALIFAGVFLLADPASRFADLLREALGTRIKAAFGKNLVTSFFVDGLLGGAGTVLAFMPQIVLLSVAMEVLEGSGYLARGAFLIDRILRLMGLSGRSFLPLLMGHACAVPAIGATRVIRDPRERLTTILVLPLTQCSARLPTYALILSAFFSHRSVLFRAGVFIALYVFGIASAAVASFFLRRSSTKGKSLPLVLEIPEYRRPEPSVVFSKAKRTAARFLKDVGTTIVASAAVLWVLLSVPVSRGSEPPIERSAAAAVGHTLEPVTKAAGFDWRLDVALLGSFGARELMVGTMGVIVGIEGAEDDPAPLAQKLREMKKDDGSPLYGTRTAASLLVFFVLACQCMSTVAAIRRETKSLKWPLFVLGYTYSAGYVAAVIVYQLGGWFGLA